MSAVTETPSSETSHHSTTTKARSAALLKQTSTRLPAPPAAMTGANSEASCQLVGTDTLIAAQGTTLRPGAGAAKTNEISPSSILGMETDKAIKTVQDNEKEHGAEQWQLQMQALQLRLDQALLQHNQLEERVHESDERIENLENEKREALRQKREIENIYEAEQSSMIKQREESSTREEEMQAIIQKLKETLNNRAEGDEDSRISRRSNNQSPILDGNQFAPSDSNRSDSRNNSKLLLQKDRLIESLRLELAEAQIKLVESENMGGGRLQEIEKQLLEARMTNARLMEDNESYQLHLSEKNMGVDAVKDELTSTVTHNLDALSALEGRAAPSNLTEDLSGSREGENRRLEAELKSSQDQNKALTLYVNKIIERLVQHPDFETIIDQTSEFRPGLTFLSKDLPPIPRETNGASILQRAKTVAMGGSRRQRPQSFMPPSTQSLVTDQGTAPSIPLSNNRASSYRSSRPRSEQFTAGVTTSFTQQIYRSGHTSPPLGPQSPRPSPSHITSSTQHTLPHTVNRAPSSGQVPTAANFSGMRSECSSISGDSGEMQTSTSNSPPRIEKATTFAGNKPRPLRLLRENTSEEEAGLKNAKRASWMGWAFVSFLRKIGDLPDQQNSGKKLSLVGKYIRHQAGRFALGVLSTGSV
ncbi:BgTH12-03945 [Blumeria graminis f. sp. triticale]|uniref:BgTH12-03945 n=1 Tax=Blumeria graminis f. sp. triticale TaxID=1689686 RepID=A0A9W4GBS8_BLUGR|nr:BgTH12-03945 [Blumeria graminis f. sp. triticale]